MHLVVVAATHIYSLCLEWEVADTKYSNGEIYATNSWHSSAFFVLPLPLMMMMPLLGWQLFVQQLQAPFVSATRSAVVVLAEGLITILECLQLPEKS